MPVVECNEPLTPLSTLRSPRVWLSMLDEDLPGKWLKTRVQLHHGLVDEDTKYENRVTALYKTVLQAFAKQFGDSTRCFLLRAPEAVELVGQYLPSGLSAAFAHGETVFCVAPRKDKTVSILHVDAAFAPIEFGLSGGLPKGRVNDWTTFNAAKFGAHWTGAIQSALQHFVNGHTGPTGQIEVDIPGLNIVVGSVPLGGFTTHCDTSLAAAAFASISAVTNEWGKRALSEVVIAIEEAVKNTAGRKCSAAAVCFGMPLEVLHIERDPSRAKGHALTAGTALVLAHTGVTVTPPAIRKSDVTTMLEGLKRGWIERLSESASAADALLADHLLYDVIADTPDAQRGTALYMVTETRRAQRAMEAIRRGDADALGVLMNIGHAADEVTGLRISHGGAIEERFEIPDSYTSDALETMAFHGDPLWKQPGRSLAGSPETDLLVGLAQSVNGVYGARRVGDQLVAAICKKEVVQFVKERLVGGYYSERGLPTNLVSQVHACRGVSIVECT